MTLPIINSAIICDDVREERNGKQILIGVYLNDIVVLDFPAQLLLTLWLACEPFSAIASGEMRVLTGDEATIVRATFKVEAVQNKLSVIPFVGIPLHLQKEGDISFQWKLAETDWVTIKTIKVLKGSVLPFPPS